MPIYTFKCLNCYIEIEQEFSFHDEPLIRCADCQQYMAKQFTAPAVHFNGTGWGKD